MEMSGDLRWVDYGFVNFNLVYLLQIDDHNVPSLEQMFELVDDVKAWLQGGEGRERVVALHCKGGGPDRHHDLRYTD